jgi:hypothetical protein
MARTRRGLGSEQLTQEVALLGWLSAQLVQGGNRLAVEGGVDRVLAVGEGEVCAIGVEVAIGARIETLVLSGLTFFSGRTCRSGGAAADLFSPP